MATNVAARGIHVDDLDLVVNVDPPTDHKDYLHRGGRTARAGESGSVVTLVLPEQRREMTRLMADAGITPRTTRIKSSDEELTRITGAREPSGVPVVIEVPQPADAAEAAHAVGRCGCRCRRYVPRGQPGPWPSRRGRHRLRVRSGRRRDALGRCGSGRRSGSRRRIGPWQRFGRGCGARGWLRTKQRQRGRARPQGGVATYAVR